MYDVIAFGSATQDVLVSADAFRIGRDAEFQTGQALRLPLGAKVPIESLVFASGGGGTNAAVTFARQGFRTACISVVGRDSSGTAVLDELRREGVDAKHMLVHDDDLTAYSIIINVPSSGERTILSYKGEGMHWQVDRVPWDRLEAKWAYVNSLGGHLDVLDAIVRWARGAGVHLATNPGGKELELGLEKLAPLWKSFDVVGMNQEEAALVTGISYERADDIFRKMDEMIGGIFIMTKGSEGCVVSDGHFVYSAGVPSQKVVERTGAGDAFHSGFLAEFMRSGSIEKAVQFGTANASAVVGHIGAKAGILRTGGSEKSIAVAKRKLE